MTAPTKRGLSATEALLSQAAALTPAEAHTARLALIAAAGKAMTAVDRSVLVAGDGSAGNELLGGVRPGAWAGVGPSCAIRSSRLLTRPLVSDEIVLYGEAAAR